MGQANVEVRGGTDSISENSCVDWGKVVSWQLCFGGSAIIVGFTCLVKMVTLCDAYINRCFQWTTLIERTFHVDNSTDRFVVTY